ncbi:hypothetical protein MLD38_011681 [Melastoma candidum]|uniref:Uncharacterized protein n=1 Tax=Melastoma candidum TaxID=119954 RepID=A0ACB9RC64_9MYRT|nr:hypothetical protein MLD38_011681 [Melastoma candidum]
MTRRNLLLILDDDSSYSTDLPSSVDLPRPLPLSPDESPAHPQRPLEFYHASYIPLTVIVLLTVLLFMAFFSLYLRCFSSSDPSPSPARRGSPPSEAEAAKTELPEVSYREGDHPHGQSDCTVCLSEFQEGEKVKVIPRCRHVFHPDCLDSWLSSHLSCPVCRTVPLPS